MENFYPSISSNLFRESIEFPKQFIQIPDDDLSILIQTRKTLLFKVTTPCIKKRGYENLDVPLGCFDGAEICELVGTYIQRKIDYYQEHGGRRIIS